MTIWLARRISTDDYDGCDALVVRADSEFAARRMAGAFGRDLSSSAWMDGRITQWVSLDPLGAPAILYADWDLPDAVPTE